MAQMIVVRIDPALYAFRAHYRPDAPLLVREWADALPEAVALINANFFDPQQQVLGLLVADGVVYGTPYTTRGGLFAIQDGLPRIRSNLTEPYQPGEALEQAVQAFPMLIEDGAPAFFNETGDRSTRRTAIGIDSQGRVIWIVTPLIGLTLAEMSAFLTASDLGIVDAFNLDGGGSTMLWLRPLEYALVSRDRVPAVLALYLH
jgi:exopolysaccharide biosynthesis protein